MTGSGSLGKNLLDEDESEHLHVHIMVMNGAHKLMSLTYCTYLFLCVKMSHYVLMGIKRPHGYQEMHCTKKIHDTTIDFSRNFTSHLRDTVLQANMAHNVRIQQESPGICAVIFLI